jgi:hypothetical protein
MTLPKSRSIASITITLNGDLYASLKTLLISFIFAFSEYPTIFSGDTSLIKGKSLELAILAANAVFPEFGGPICHYRNIIPWRRTDTNGVRVLFFTCSIKSVPSDKIRYS